MSESLHLHDYRGGYFERLLLALHQLRESSGMDSRFGLPIPHS